MPSGSAAPNMPAVENVEEIVDAPSNRGTGALAGRVREAARAQRRARPPHASNSSSAPLPWLSREPGVRAEVRRPRDHMGRGAATAGRPYLARAAEEHSGPHMPWFWRGELQGGGVLNDMMCHSALVVRHLLAKPGAPLSTVRPVRVTGSDREPQVVAARIRARASENDGKKSTTRKQPSEDFASVTSSSKPTMVTRDRRSYRLRGVLSAPGSALVRGAAGAEYSMSWNTLDSGLKLFFRARCRARPGGSDRETECREGA